MYTPDGYKLSVDEQNTLLDQLVWGLADDSMPPRLDVFDVDGQRFVAVFSSPELALAQEIATRSVVRSDVWNALRGTPSGADLVVDAGQNSTVTIAADEIDALLDGDRLSASRLSRRRRAGLATAWVLMLESPDGRAGLVSVGELGTAVAVWTDQDAAESHRGESHRLVQAPLADVLRSALEDAAATVAVLDTGTPAEIVVDRRLATEILQAGALFPPGFHAGVGPVAEDLAEVILAVAVEALRPSGAQAIGVLGYQTEGAAPQILLLTKGMRAGSDAGELMREVGRADSPQPVWHVALDDLPADIRGFVEDNRLMRELR